MLLKLLIFITFSCFCNPGWTKEIYEPFQSVRQLAMGGVYVFNQTDSGSFLQNPAYSCYTKGLNWTLFDGSIGAGDLQSYKSLVGTTGSFPSPTNMDGLTPFFGKNVWIRDSGFSSMTLPCFGIAAKYSRSADIALHNPAFPQLYSYYIADREARLGGSLPLSDVLSFGVAIKRIDRVGGPKIFGPNDLANLNGSNNLKSLLIDNQNSGSGYGLDAGLAARFSMLPLNPTFSLAMKDAGGTSFNSSASGSKSPEQQKENLVVGATIDGSLPLMGVAAGLELRHLTDKEEQFGKKVHLGAEASVAFLDARAGLYQGYPTYGIGLGLWFFQLDAAYYKIEKGSYPGQSPDERIEIGVLFDLAFDPNFRLVNYRGKKRHFKQRR